MLYRIAGRAILIVSMDRNPLSSGSSRRLEPPNVDDKDYNHSKLRKVAKGHRVTSQKTRILSYTGVNLKPHYKLK